MREGREGEEEDIISDNGRYSHSILLKEWRSHDLI